jgi:hypothetical protein
MPEEGTVPVKMLAVIDTDCSYLTYCCFGVLGKRIVLLVAKPNCTIKTHTNVKMSFVGLDESFVFIHQNILGSVLSKPKLLALKMPDAMMAEWESTKNLSMMECWSTEFQASIDGTSELLTLAEGIQTKSDFF